MCSCSIAWSIEGDAIDQQRDYVAYGQNPEIVLTLPMIVDLALRKHCPSSATGSVLVRPPVASVCCGHLGSASER